MWKVKDKEIMIGTYIETWGDSTGYVTVSQGEGGVLLHGKVKRGYELIFVKSIEKAHDTVLNVDIEEIEEDNKLELDLLTKEIRKIYERNQENIEHVDSFPY